MPDAPPPPPAPSSLPAPDARDRVAETLTRLFADDRIGAEELEARLARVYRAATGAELEAIVADLPQAPAETPGAAPVPAQRVEALLSGVERRVTGAVPREMRVRSRLGYVELDLTGATFENGVSVIDVRALMGYVQIRFPAHVRVECQGRAIAGFFSLHGTPTAPASATQPVVHVTGRAIMGFAECSVAGSDAPRLPPGSS